MRRRELIRYAGASTALAAVGSGCLEEGSPGNETDDDVTGDDGDERETTVTGTSFSVLSRREGGGNTDSASYSFKDGTLEVTGTVMGSDACKTAELGGAEYDEDEEAIVVDIETVNAEGAGDMCAEVLTPIRYEATVEFEGGSPGVVVTHDGQEVDTSEGRGDETDGNRPEMTGSEFEVTGSECGTETNEAEYTPSQGMSENNESTGVVEGTVSGPDSCTTAELGYVSYDREDDTLVADVRSGSTDAEVCEDCITEVNYLLEATFEGGVPDSAAVSHDGIRVDAVGDGVEDAEFGIEDIENGAGSGDGSSDAEFDDDEGQILVTGSIVGNDGCARARLSEAVVEDDTLKLGIETVSDGSDVCTEALVGIRYTATFVFDGEIPNEVSVSHDGQGVMSAAYGSESVSESPQSDSSE
jgi:hypothetical protein